MDPLCSCKQCAAQCQARGTFATVPSGAQPRDSTPLLHFQTHAHSPRPVTTHHACACCKCKGTRPLPRTGPGDEPRARASRQPARPAALGLWQPQLARPARTCRAPLRPCARRAPSAVGPNTAGAAALRMRARGAGSNRVAAGAGGAVARRQRAAECRRATGAVAAGGPDGAVPCRL
eukprot:365603-Chlamydomonas_euryale.AAC.20